MNAVTLQDLSLARGERVVVQHLSGRFEPGTLTAVMGPNGAGKSSLLAAIAGQLRPVRGRVLRPAGQRLAWLAQQPLPDRSLPLAVGDLVALGAWHEVGCWRGLGRQRQARVDDALATVGLTGLAPRLIGELSAGQLQRALLARVLMQDAPLILLDEPFNALDERSTAELLPLLARWRGEGRTVVAVLHDAAQVRAHVERTLLLAREPIAWGPTAEVLTPRHLARARWAGGAAQLHREAA